VGGWWVVFGVFVVCGGGGVGVLILFTVLDR